MASANHDANQLKLSRKIFDPVAAAATDGSEATQALRNDYLNRANKFIQRFVYDADKSPEKVLVQRYLSGLLTTSTVTITAGAGPIPATASYVIGVAELTGNEKFDFVPSTMIQDFNVNASSFKRRYYTKRGSNIYVYENGSAYGSNVTLTYLTDDQRASNGDTADIAIDSIWFECLVDLAATYHFEDKGKYDFATAQEQRSKLVLSMITQ